MPTLDSKDTLFTNCSVERLKVIAKSMHLTALSRPRKDELRVFISNAMLRITECPTCGGG